MWKKVVGPTLLITFLWLSVSGATTYYIFWLSEFNTRILKENVSSIRAAGRMQAALWNLQSAFLDAIADLDDHDRERQERELGEIEDRFLAAWNDARESAATTAEPDLIRTIDVRFGEYRNLVHHGLQRHRDTSRNDALLIDQSTQMASDVAAPCAAIVRINEELMATAIARRSQTEQSYQVIRLAFLIAGPALGIWVGIRIARNLHQSISQISVTLKDASGDLDQEIGSVEIVPERAVGDLSVLNEQVQLISTRIRQVLSELQRVRQEAVRSERLAVVGELAAGVAHEIRNPLTAVKLLVQTASRTEQGVVQLESRQAQVILQEVLRMEETIQALLDFASPPQLHRVHHDLRDTLQRALNLVEGRARLERVTIVPRLSDSALTVDGDPEQLHQVFVNLLINGIESMHEGGSLFVSAEADEASGVCRVIVADSGTGIPPERIARIFEPFVTTKPRGTGLGLAVTRRIVREHGGTIVAGNRPEGGATFTVELQSSEIPQVPPKLPSPLAPAIKNGLLAVVDSSR